MIPKVKIAEYKSTLLNYRHYLLKYAINKSVIKRKDNRVKSIRYCYCCGRLLSDYDYANNKYKVKCNYYKLVMANKETHYMCYNDSVCKNYLRNKQDNDIITIYKVVQ